MSEMFNTGHLAASGGSRTRSQGNEVRALGWANTKKTGPDQLSGVGWQKSKSLVRRHVRKRDVDRRGSGESELRR